MARSNSNSNNRPALYHQASSSQPQQRINNGRHQSAASSSSTTGAKARDADNCCSVKFVKNVLHMFNIIFFVSRPEWVHCTVYCTVLYYTPPHFAICTLTSTYVTTCHNSKCIENHVAFIIHSAVIIDSQSSVVWEDYGILWENVTAIEQKIYGQPLVLGNRNNNSSNQQAAACFN